MHFLWLCVSQIALTDDAESSLGLATPIAPFTNPLHSSPRSVPLLFTTSASWQPVVSARNRYANWRVSSAVSGEQRGFLQPPTEAGNKRKKRLIGFLGEHKSLRKPGPDHLQLNLACSGNETEEACSGNETEEACSGNETEEAIVSVCQRTEQIELAAKRLRVETPISQRRKNNSRGMTCCGRPQASSVAVASDVGERIWCDKGGRAGEPSRTQMTHIGGTGRGSRAEAYPEGDANLADER
uniref:Uncharacterized protein n=1 Tax=Knipowitschia caucasica TaxID=637954 RepID=A0AAV2KTS1_KNICA